MDFNSFYNNIQAAITQDEILQKHLYYLVEHWLLNTFGLLLKNEKIYILLIHNLYTYILQYYHNHIFAEYFRQNKILELICYSYTWLSLYADVKKFCNSCVTEVQTTTLQALWNTQATFDF